MSVTNRTSRLSTRTRSQSTGLGNALAVEADLVPIMPAHELGRHDAIVNLRKGLQMDVLKIMKCENHGDAPALGQGDHSQRDGISAVGEHHIRPVNL